MQIADFIDVTNRAQTPDVVLDVFQKAMADRGFDHVHYVSAQPHPQTDGLCISTTFPDVWISRYMEQGYLDCDPLLRYGALYRSAFLWSEAIVVNRFNRLEKRIMAEAGACGLHDGIGVPLHGPPGELHGISVAAGQAHQDAGRFLSEVFVLAQQFNRAYSDLVMPRDLDVPRLTAREREVLQWAASGKSNWAIGEILSISEHGVDYHLRNILRKLNADSKITAVVKGLRLGLVDL